MRSQSLTTLCPVTHSRTTIIRMATIAMRPFQVSALLVHPVSHMTTGDGRAERSRSYACSNASSSPAKTGQTKYGQHYRTNRCCVVNGIQQWISDFGTIETTQSEIKVQDAFLQKPFGRTFVAKTSKSMETSLDTGVDLPKPVRKHINT